MITMGPRTFRNPHIDHHNGYVGYGMGMGMGMVMGMGVGMGMGMGITHMMW